MNPIHAPWFARHRFPAEVISHAIWLYFRFPLSLRMVEEMLAARGILVMVLEAPPSIFTCAASCAKPARTPSSMPGDATGAA